MATDASILDDLDTETAAVNATGSAEGFYRIHGYDPITDKLIFSDEEGQLYTVDRDGTNLAHLMTDAGAFTHGPTGGGIETPKGWIDDGRLYIVGNSGGCRVIDILNGTNLGQLFISGDTGSSRDGTKTVYSPDAGDNGRIWWVDDGDNLRMWDIDDASVTFINNGSDTNTVAVSLAVHPTRVNSDSKVGLVWYSKGATAAGAAKRTVSTYPGDTATAGAYASVDLATGWPGSGITEIIDMVYDAENERVYLLIQTGGTPAAEIWTMDMDESPDVSTAVKVGDVDDEADANLSALVLYYDSYDSAAGTISALEPDLWLDAADVLDAGAATPSDGAAIDSWPNKGAGADPIDIVGCTYDADNANLNNLPAVNFDGTDDHVQLANGTVGWPMTFFVVMDKDDDSADGYVLWTGERLGTGQTFSFWVGGGEDVEWFSESDDTIRDIFAPSSSVATGEGVILSVADRTVDNFIIVGQLYDATNGENGVLQADTGAPVPITADMDTPQMIGARPDATLPSTARHFDGRIAEVVVFNRQMSNAEVHVVREELKTKYAL